MINHLNLVVIFSRNLEISVSFYQSLGLTLEKEQHGNGLEDYSCQFENLIFWNNLLKVFVPMVAQL